jgi:hypothetical protein
MYLMQVILLDSVPTPLIPKSLAPANSRSFSVITFQNNNATGEIRIGDATVSATRGIMIDPAATTGKAGGAYTITPSLQFTGDLTEFYFYGTAGAIVDVMICD